jgi:hypothetical protein
MAYSSWNEYFGKSGKNVGTKRRRFIKTKFTNQNYYYRRW